MLSTILRVIELHSEMAEPVSFARPVCSDPDDDKFLEAALVAHAGYLVTADAALLNLKLYRRIEIARPTQFLRSLPQQPSRRS